ncbi:hypothetical protein L596_028024 [Steinernema carpocapsae]|uniref:RING-type domain-containing protein n=1 Tax=Steinernema carpocapsae TaxID=34508 RepID=A0A4U5LX97_STECR|nr:hypothetical protein L596_028024 [Steinernema carpocapsae]
MDEFFGLLSVFSLDSCGCAPNRFENILKLLFALLGLLIVMGVTEFCRRMRRLRDKHMRRKEQERQRTRLNEAAYSSTDLEESSRSVFARRYLEDSPGRVDSTFLDRISAPSRGSEASIGSSQASTESSEASTWSSQASSGASQVSNNADAVKDECQKLRNTLNKGLSRFQQLMEHQLKSALQDSTEMTEELMKLKKALQEAEKNERAALETCRMLSEEQNTTCVVCMDARREVVFRGCNHFATCSTCSAQMQRCCMCNSHIVEKIKVYYS